MCPGATSAFDGVGELKAAEKPTGTGQASTLNGDEDDAETQNDDRWEHVGTGDPDGLSSSAGPSADVLSAAPCDYNPASETTKEPQDEIAFLARFGIVFDIGNTEQVASGLMPVAADVNKRIVQSAVKVVWEVPDSMVTALSAAHGNFDRVVALGWLIADAVRAVGSPMLDRKQALAVGLKAKQEATNIKTDLQNLRRVAMREVGALDADNAVHVALKESRLKKLDEAQDDLLSQAVRWTLPSQAAPTTSLATGSRKRARDPVVSPEDAQDQLVADSLAEYIQAVNDVKPAWLAKADAEAKGFSKMRVLAKIIAQNVKKGAKLDAHENYLSLVRGAMTELDKAHIAAKQAHVLYMGALLAESRAENKCERLAHERFEKEMRDLF